MCAMYGKIFFCAGILSCAEKYTGDGGGSSFTIISYAVVSVSVKGFILLIS